MYIVTKAPRLKDDESKLVQDFNYISTRIYKDYHFAANLMKHIWRYDEPDIDKWINCLNDTQIDTLIEDYALPIEGEQKKEKLRNLVFDQMVRFNESDEFSPLLRHIGDEILVKAIGKLIVENGRNKIYWQGDYDIVRPTGIPLFVTGSPSSNEYETDSTKPLILIAESKVFDEAFNTYPTNI